MEANKCFFNLGGLKISEYPILNGCCVCWVFCYLHLSYVSLLLCLCRPCTTLSWPTQATCECPSPSRSSNALLQPPALAPFLCCRPRTTTSWQRRPTCVCRSANQPSSRQALYPHSHRTLLCPWPIMVLLSWLPSWCYSNQAVSRRLPLAI